MKKLILLLITISIFNGCDDFQEINTDPNIGIPPAEFLFTKVEKDLGVYKGGGEWYHENHQKMTWSQYLTQGEANAGDINSILPGSKYGTFYGSVMAHLDETRLQISYLSEEEQKSKQKLVAASDIIQVFFGLRITDQYGDIPYSEAGKGRYEDILNPVYDKQVDLLDQFVAELDNAIQLLSENVSDEFDFSDNDFIYNGDTDKWIRLANAVKLRIATRLLSQNETKARDIIANVVADGRLFESNDDQFTFDIGGDYRGSAGAGFEWKGLMWSAEPIIEFMKSTMDPRLRIFFEINGYTQESIDAFDDPSDISPAVDIVNDNAVLFTTTDGEDILGYRFIGAPTHRQDPTVSIPGYYQFIDDPITLGPNTPMVSKYNRRLIQTCDYAYGGLPSATGNYVDVMLSYAEVCFMMSEFILKEYATGNAEDWYNKGINSSLTTYNMIASIGELDLIVANKTYPYLEVSETEINDYLTAPEVSFNGLDDLEKVYIQQYLNFFRLPSEGWILSMRTGYPKYGSSLLARFPTDDNEIPFPRRIPTPEPGDLNLENWQSANESQGFSPRDENPQVLNSQRLWWDLNNPTIGSGGN